MASMIKLSEAGAIALHAGVFLAGRPEQVCPAGVMASALRVSEAHLVKVLQRLARAGLVRGTRGPGGGFVLARPPARIRLRDLYEAIEGPLKPVVCLFPHRVCRGRNCILRGQLRDVSRQSVAYLTKTTLGALAGMSWRRPDGGSRRAVA